MSVMVITGGTAGAGKATALRFARAGYHVALIARDETGLQETRQACERFGIKTLAISADVVDAGALQRAAAEVETTLGAIDVWINNAMTTVLAPFRQMSEEEFRRVTEVTYLGYVNGTRAALEVMIPRDRGVIIQAELGAGLAFNPTAVGLLRSESGDPRLYRCRANRTDA
ncbi:SDR family NAD(P)-dependent oxidoreductase [Klebsiella pneumoniae]